MRKILLQAVLRLFRTNYIHIFLVFCIPATDPCLRSTKMQIKIKLAAANTCSPVLEKQPYVIDWKWQVAIPVRENSRLGVSCSYLCWHLWWCAGRAHWQGWVFRWGRAQCVYCIGIYWLSKISALHLCCDRKNYILASPEIKCYALNICVLSRKITKAYCLHSLKC